MTITLTMSNFTTYQASILCEFAEILDVGITFKNANANSNGYTVISIGFVY